MGQTLPYIAIYPGDWLQSELEAESLELQGLWLRMMFVMSRSESYGELVINGEPMTDEFIAKKCRISQKKYRKYLEIFENIGVLKRKPNGVIYSGRMDRKRRELEQNRARQKNFYDKTHGKIEEKESEEGQKPNATLTGHTHARHISVSNQVKEEEIREIPPTPLTKKPEAGMVPPEVHIGVVIVGVLKEFGLKKMPQLEEREWIQTASLAFENDFSPDQFLECLRLLRKQTWRASAVKPKHVFENLPDLEKLRKENNGANRTSNDRKQTPGEIIANRPYRE